MCRVEVEIQRVCILLTNWGILRLLMWWLHTSLWWIWICGQLVLLFSWLSYIATLHKEISMLPLSLRDHTSAAVIVPAFFLAKEPILERCSTILSCALEWVYFLQLTNRSEKAFPTNKTQLLRCLHNNMCLTKKKNTQTHVLASLFSLPQDVYSEWMEACSFPTTFC